MKYSPSNNAYAKKNLLFGNESQKEGINTEMLTKMEMNKGSNCGLLRRTKSDKNILDTFTLLKPFDPQRWFARNRFSHANRHQIYNKHTHKGGGIFLDQSLNTHIHLKSNSSSKDHIHHRVSGSNGNNNIFQSLKQQKSLHSGKYFGIQNMHLQSNRGRRRLNHYNNGHILKESFSRNSSNNSSSNQKLSSLPKNKNRSYNMSPLRKILKSKTRQEVVSPFTQMQIEVRNRQNHKNNIKNGHGYQNYYQNHQMYSPVKHRNNLHVQKRNSQENADQNYQNYYGLQQCQMNQEKTLKFLHKNTAQQSHSHDKRNKSKSNNKNMLNQLGEAFTRKKVDKGDEILNRHISQSQIWRGLHNNENHHKNYNGRQFQSRLNLNKIRSSQNLVPPNYNHNKKTDTSLRMSSSKIKRYFNKKYNEKAKNAIHIQSAAHLDYNNLNSGYGYDDLRRQGVSNNRNSQMRLNHIEKKIMKNKGFHVPDMGYTAVGEQYDSFSQMGRQNNSDRMEYLQPGVSHASSSESSTLNLHENVSIRLSQFERYDSGVEHVEDGEHSSQQYRHEGFKYSQSLIISNNNASSLHQLPSSSSPDNQSSHSPNKNTIKAPNKYKFQLKRYFKTEEKNHEGQSDSGHGYSPDRNTKNYGVLSPGVQFIDIIRTFEKAQNKLMNSEKDSIGSLKGSEINNHYQSQYRDSNKEKRLQCSSNASVEERVQSSVRIRVKELSSSFAGKQLQQSEGKIRSDNVIGSVQRGEYYQNTNEDGPQQQLRSSVTKKSSINLRKSPNSSSYKQKKSILSKLKKNIQMDKQKSGGNVRSPTERKESKKIKNSPDYNLSSDQSQIEQQKVDKPSEDLIKQPSEGNSKMLKKPVASSSIVDLSELIQGGGKPFPAMEQQMALGFKQSQKKWMKSSNFLASKQLEKQNIISNNPNSIRISPTLPPPPLILNNSKVSQERSMPMKNSDLHASSVSQGVSISVKVHASQSSSPSSSYAAMSNPRSSQHQSELTCNAYTYTSGSNSHTYTNIKMNTQLPLNTIKNEDEKNFCIEEVDESQDLISDLNDGDSKSNSSHQFSGGLFVQESSHNKSQNNSQIQMPSSPPYVSTPTTENNSLNDLSSQNSNSKSQREREAEEKQENMHKEGANIQGQSDNHHQEEQASQYAQQDGLKKFKRQQQMIKEGQTKTPQPCEPSPSQLIRKLPQKTTPTNTKQRSSKQGILPSPENFESIKRKQTSKPNCSLSQNQVARYMEEHSMRIWSMYMYIESSKGVYEEDDYHLQKLQYLHFLLLKKYLVELQKVIKYLTFLKAARSQQEKILDIDKQKGKIKDKHPTSESTIFSLSEIEIPENIIKKFIRGEMVDQQLNNTIKEFQDTKKQFIEMYHTIKNKYEGEVGFDTNLDEIKGDETLACRGQSSKSNRNIIEGFSHELVNHLREELLYLYDKWQCENLSQNQSLHSVKPRKMSESKNTIQPTVSQIKKYEKRMIETIEIIFLISEFAGKKIKSCSLLKDSDNQPSEYFQIYYEKYYEKLIEVYEYFDKSEKNQHA